MVQSYPEAVVMILSCFRVLEAFSQVRQVGGQVFTQFKADLP